MASNLEAMASNLIDSSVKFCHEALVVERFSGQQEAASLRPAIFYITYTCSAIFCKLVFVSSIARDILLTDPLGAPAPSSACKLSDKGTIVGGYGPRKHSGAGSLREAF